MNTCLFVGFFPLLCVSRCWLSQQATIPTTKASCCCCSLLLDTWKQSACFPSQTELCWRSAHEKWTYGPCRFIFQAVKQRFTGIFVIIISSCSPCLDWVHAGTNDSDSVAMSRAKSPHLSQLICSRLDMNWDGFICRHYNGGRGINVGSERAWTCLQKASCAFDVTQHQYEHRTACQLHRSGAEAVAGQVTVINMHVIKTRVWMALLSAWEEQYSHSSYSAHNSLFIGSWKS